MKNALTVGKKDIMLEIDIQKLSKKSSKMRKLLKWLNKLYK